MMGLDYIERWWPNWKSIGGRISLISLGKTGGGRRGWERLGRKKGQRGNL